MQHILNLEDGWRCGQEYSYQSIKNSEEKVEFLTSCLKGNFALNFHKNRMSGYHDTLHGYLESLALEVFYFMSFLCRHNAPL